MVFQVAHEHYYLVHSTEIISSFFYFYFFQKTVETKKEQFFFFFRNIFLITKIRCINHHFAHTQKLIQIQSSFYFF